jgi:Tol biopolymer transport system component
MNAILRDDPPGLPDPVPPALDRIVRRCLEKAPDRRFQSAAELGVALQSLSLSPGRTERPAKGVWRRWAPLAAASATVMGAALLWLTRPLPPPRITGTVQITNDGRGNRAPMLTDGTRLYFNLATYGAPRQVSVKGGESIPLSLPMTNAWPVDISPDRTEFLISRMLPFSAADWALDRVRYGLWVAPLLGGSSRRLSDLVAIETGTGGMGSGDGFHAGESIAYGSAAAWSPDGRQLVYVRDKELHLARSDGAEVRKLATLASAPFFVRWAPDGRSLRFSASDGTRTGSTLWSVSIDDGRVQHLLPGWNPSWYTCCGNWTPDGKYFVFQSRLNIWALREKAGYFRRASREPVQLTTGPIQAYWPLPSLDGKRLFIAGYQDRNEFLRYDLRSDRFVPELAGVSGTALEFSKDGKWLAYISIPEGSLVRIAANGSQRLHLTLPPLRAGMPRWSPDGRQLAFEGRFEGEPSRVYIAAFDGGAPRRVTNGQSGRFGDFDPSWSPDGASLAFGSTSRAAAAEEAIHVVDLKTNRVWKLPGSEGMWSPRWSPDGHFIAGLSGELNKLTLYDLPTQKQAVLFDLGSGWPSWSTDGEFLFFSSDGWRRVQMRGRTVARLANANGPRLAGYGWFAAAPNNSLITARDAGTEEIYALDWEAP